jgi:hypothetical protein
VQDTIELARNPLAADHFLIIQLLRDLDTGEYSIRIIWPDGPTEFPPTELSPVSNMIVITLATARTQFAAIRSAEG